VFEQMFQTLGPLRAQFLLGRASYEATLFPQAEENFLGVLRLDPNFPGARLELGKVYISLRRPDDATRQLQAVLKQNPADADAGYFLGAVLVQADRYAESISYLERATKAKPDFWAPFFYLGKAKLRLNEPAAAVSLLERAVKLNSDDATAAYLLGQALEDCGRNEEAKRAFQRVRELQAAAAADSPADDRRVAGAR
jgi:tetratricopeptide (TPR) repeat protein